MSKTGNIKRVYHAVSQEKTIQTSLVTKLAMVVQHKTFDLRFILIHLSILIA